MKTILRKMKSSYFMYAILLLSIMSCQEIDDFAGNPSVNPRVETLIEGFGANDGLSIDISGRLYASNFAGYGGTEVLKVDPRKATVVDTISDLRAPTGNTIDISGNVYIVHNIRRISADTQETFADVIKVSKTGERTVLATLPGFPSGITLDKRGNVYVSNYILPVIHKITTDGVLSEYVNDPLLAGGVGIDFDSRDNLYVGNFVTGNIVKIDKNVNISIFATIPTVVPNTVIGYISYASEAIFATAIGENVIYKVDMQGNASIFAGNGEKMTADGSLSESSFNRPNGIVADAIRKVIYVSEADPNGSLRVIRLR